MTRKHKDLVMAFSLIVITIVYFWLIPNIAFDYIWFVGTIILLVLSSLSITRLIQSYVPLSLMKFILISVIFFPCTLLSVDHHVLCRSALPDESLIANWRFSYEILCRFKFCEYRRRTVHP